MKSLFATFSVVFFLVTTGEGKMQILQQLIGPSNPLSISARYLQNNISENSTEDDTQVEARVKLPPLPCTTNIDCLEFHEPLFCDNGQCNCIRPLCWVYQYESSGWTSSNVFRCGACGQLGSWCNETYACDAPGKCFSDDGYCHCPNGENFAGICVVVDQSWTLKVTISGFGIIFLVALIVVSYNCWRNRSWEQPGWCWGACNKTGSTRGRRGSCEKTPAFTIQNHYLSQMSITNEGPTSLNESFPSTSTPRSRFRSDSDVEGIATSLRSLETIKTDLSNISVAGAVAKEEPAGAYSLSIEPSQAFSILNEASNTSADNLQKTSEYSEPSSTVFESGCTHERCTLCLPKGLSTRPSSVNSTKSSSPTGNDHEPTIQIVHQTVAIKVTDTETPDYECTQL